MKRKEHKTVVRAAMLFGEKAAEARKRLEVAEIRMPSFSLEENGMVEIKNEPIRGTQCVRWYADRDFFSSVGDKMVVNTSQDGC